MYSITGLGTLGGTESNAMDINALGHVTGYAVTPSTRNHAFLWDGSMHDLGALSGGTSYGQLIDNRDWVVGQSIANDGSDHSVLFHGGNVVDYGVVGSYSGDDLKIKDKATNSSGETIGQFWTESGEYHAGVYIDGELVKYPFFKTPIE